MTPAAQALGCPTCGHTALDLAMERVMEVLTPVERQVFDALAPGQWTPRAFVCQEIWGCADVAELHALAVNISRMRPRLAPHGWAIDRRGNSGLVRLRREQDDKTTGKDQA